MKTGNDKAAGVDSRQRIVIPCLDWELDEPTPVRIQQRPDVMVPVIVEYMGVRDFGVDFEVEPATTLKPKAKEGYLC